MRTKVLSLLVDNTSGVLSRVSGMFSRRGYNIDSLSVGETENPKYSRMTVAVTGDDRVISQIKNQLNKLEDVRSIEELKYGDAVIRELVILKIKADANQRQNIISIANNRIFRIFYIFPFLTTVQILNSYVLITPFFILCKTL